MTIGREDWYHVWWEHTYLVRKINRFNFIKQVTNLQRLDRVWEQNVELLDIFVYNTPYTKDILLPPRLKVAFFLLKPIRMWRKDTSIRFVIFASLYSLVTPIMNGNLKLKDVIFIVLRNCTHFIKIPLKYEYLFIRVLLYSWDKLRLGQGQGQVITTTEFYEL